MKKMTLSLFKYMLSCGIIILALESTITSCHNENEWLEPKSIFQYLPSEDNIREITFVNFSKNASSYLWDFGDGTTSDEESPVHEYADFSTFEVKLTVTNPTSTSISTRELTITDPNARLNILTGETNKTWKLIRGNSEDLYAYETGPVDHSGAWWTFGTGGDNTFEERPCLANDEFTFYRNGQYVFDDKGDTYAEGNGRFSESIAWQCIDTTDPSKMIGANGDDLSAWGSGTFSFAYNSSTDKLTVTGMGAHVGYYVAGTDQSLYVPAGSVTYNVIKLVEADVDTLVLETVYPDRYWRFVLVHYDNLADEPPLSEPSPLASYTLTEYDLQITVNNTSTNTTSYLWNFGDGTTSTEANPVHNYAEGGIYLISYKATNNSGSQTIYQGIIVGEKDPTAQYLYGDGSKTWRLANQQFSIWVGSTEASYDLWYNDQSWVDASQCIFDDEFTLNSENTYTTDIKDEMFVESGMGFSSNGCLPVDQVPESLQPWTGGEFTYAFAPTSGGNLATITVSGQGAYLGMFKPANGQEIYSPKVSTITYDIYGYIDASDKEYLLLSIDVSSNASKFWLMMLEADK